MDGEDIRRGMVRVLTNLLFEIIKGVNVSIVTRKATFSVVLDVRIHVTLDIVNRQIGVLALPIGKRI